MTTAADDAASAQLLDQERRLVLPALDEGIAVALGELILERALAESLTATVEVHVRGRLVFKAALPGTNSTNDEYLAGKRGWVERSGQASLLGSLAHQRANPRTAGEPETRVPATGPFGGGVPLRTADGELAGIALVSGLTEQEDHDLVIWALERLLGTNRGTALKG